MIMLHGKSTFCGLSNRCLFFSALLVFSLSINANSVDERKHYVQQDYKRAIHALIQGDERLANEIIGSEIKHQTKDFAEFEIIFRLEQGDIDTVIEKLEQYETVYGELAETFSFTAIVWRSVGHEVNIFSKWGYYNRALKAKVRAGQLAPEAPYFLTLQASAIGQDEALAREGETQLTLTNKIMSLNKKWGLISQINYAQNTNDQTTGIKLSKKAAAEFEKDFEIQERLGQYYWTIGLTEKAQHHFWEACKSPPDYSWRSDVAWSNACYQVAQFALQKSINIDLGVEALNILLGHYTLPTRSNFNLVVMLFKLTANKLPIQAVKILNRIVKESDDKKLVKEARVVLQTIDNISVKN